MSATYNAGIVTAYGAAVRGGYTGTYAQFCSDLADLGVVLSQLGSITASASQLPEGSSPTASYANGNFAFGIPKGDTGDQGIQGIQGVTGATPNLSIGTVTTLPAGSSATVTISGTAENPVMSMGIPKGDDPSSADIASATDAWLTEHITNPDSPPLDRSLTQSTSAAPADLVGDLDLLKENIPGTTATVTFNSAGKPASIVHDNNGTAVRTDTFVWTTNSVTETRTLADGTYITITTNLDTLVSVVSAVTEGA